MTDELTQLVYYGRFDDSGRLVGLFQATLEGGTVLKGEVLRPEGWMIYPDLLHYRYTGEVTSADQVAPDRALAYIAKVGEISAEISQGPEPGLYQPWRALFDEGEAPDIPRTCPRCGWAQVVPILWGYPDPTVVESVERGEVRWSRPRRLRSTTSRLKRKGAGDQPPGADLELELREAPALS